MVKDNDDDTIELDLDIPDKKEVDKTPEGGKETVAAKTPPVEDAVASLKKQLSERDAQLADESSRRAAAEKTARDASANAQKFETDVRSTNLTMVTNAIDSVKREQEILEANFANAMAAQDFSAAAKIQTAMSTTASKLVQLETGKQAMEEEAKQPIRRIDPSVDPVEALASQLSPRSAGWVRAHPEYARDQRLMQRMTAAHNLAITDNLKADTDEYFEHVEKTLGLRKEADREEEDEDVLSEAAAPTQRRAAPAAAPVSRSGTPNGKAANRITLTAEEREIASMTGLTDREYALQKQKIIKGNVH